MKRVLVTGGCGFIGSHIVDCLKEIAEYNVYVVDINLTWKIDDVKYFQVNINNREAVERVIKSIKPEVCLHLAGVLGTSETWDSMEETVNTNINGANNVYEICGQNKCDIITVDVGSKWMTPYTITKNCSADFAIALANKYGVKCGLLRIFNVYGPRQSTKIIKIAPMFIYKSLSNATLEVWGNKNTDLIYVTDVAKAFVLATINLDKIDKRRDIYIGSGKQITTYEFAKYVTDEISLGNVVMMKPRLGEENIDSGYMDNNVAFELLEWKPEVSLEDGLKRTIEFYKEKDIINEFKRF